MTASSGKSNRKQSSILKTTTWGALIASGLTLVVLGVGASLRGHRTSSGLAELHLAPQPTVAAAKTNATYEEKLASGAGLSGSVRPAATSQVKRGDVASAPAQIASLNESTRQLSLAAPASVATHGSSDPESLPAANDPEASQALTAAKIAPDLKNLAPDKSVDVIVQFKGSPNPADLDNAAAESKADLSLIGAKLVTVQGSNLNALASSSSVAYISPDRKIRTSTNKAVTSVNADLATANGWNGSGVGVAVIDSGVAPINSDLTSDGNTNPSRVVYSKSFVPGDSSTGDPYGHGTYIASLIAGNGFASQNNGTYQDFYRGVAPEARIINLRVLDATGAGTDSSVIAAIQQAINLKTTYKIAVINLSLSRPVFESYALDPLCQAVESAWKAGIVVVAAAGNMGEYNETGTDGYATIGVPGNDPYVITVGATNTHGNGNQTAQTITSYSSKGPTMVDHIVKPDLVAPGNAVVSRQAAAGNALSTQYPQLDVYPCNAATTVCGPQYGTSRYMTLSGTSMSTAVVSGVAALVLQENPSFAPDQLKAVLMKTAWKNFGNYTNATDLATGVKYKIEQDIFAIGAGAVDAMAALNCSCTPPSYLGAAKSPTATYNSSTNTVSLSGSSAIWFSSGVWNDSVVWCNSVVCLK